MNIQKVLFIVIIIAILGFLGWKVMGNNSGSQNVDNIEVNKIVNDPIDVTMALYSPWLAGLVSTSTEINQVEIINQATLTEGLRADLLNKLNESTSDLDPILCQIDLPEKIGAKIVYTTETESQVIVVPRGKKVPEQALVTLTLSDSGWVIAKIDCSRGELAPEREFSFDNEGYLLRESLQPPLDATKWHLVYESNGVAGYAILLIFDELSVCIGSDGAERDCATEELSEATAVVLKGAMQENGVIVRRLEVK